MLQKSQELYDEDPVANASCRVSMDDVTVSAIQLVVKYKVNSFCDKSSSKELQLHALGLYSAHIFTRVLSVVYGDVYVRSQPFLQRVRRG